MKWPVDIEAQFKKLCPGDYRNETPKEQMLEIVNTHLNGIRTLSHRNRWTYNLNRHIALAELRDAIKAEMAHAD